MGMRNRAAWAIMAVVLLQNAGVGGEEGKVATAPAKPTWDQAQWRSVLERLGQPSFAGRETATTELARLGKSDLADLRSYAEATQDAEVRARLESRIAELQGPQLTL